jgi:MFS family permease
MFCRLYVHLPKRSIGVALFGANLVAINGLILGLLFVSRILDGLTGGNISVAQAYISDVTPPEDRGRAFGLIGAAFRLGFIIGPVVGGLLAERFDYAAPAFVAMTIATVNLIAVYFYLLSLARPWGPALFTSVIIHHGVGGVVYLAAAFRQPRSTAGAARRRFGRGAAARCSSRALSNL